MPNFKVFQDLPSQLRTRIYGLNGGTDVAILVDASGVLGIQDNGGSITVDTASGALDITATDLDIRDITNATDSILIYGQDSTATNRVILTDPSGRLNTISYPDFTEATETVSTDAAYADGTSRDVSLYGSYSFWVQNIGQTNTATVKLEISPDDTNWLIDGTEEEVGTETAIVLNANRFLRYTHVAYKSTTAGSDTSLVITWNAWSVS